MRQKHVHLAPAESRTRCLREQNVLLDTDLAASYELITKALLQAVRRNPSRLPSDFMFQLTDQEVTNLRSQTVISSSRSVHGGRRYRPYAFTEQGVAMLSSVLRSPAAITVNIEIMRAFVRLRRAGLVSAQLSKVVDELARRVDKHDAAIKALIDSIQKLISPEAPKRRPIGFVPID
jgi:ORF6N domain